MSHSAEFLRGAVEALEKTLGFRSNGLPWVVPMGHQERVSVWDNYRISLVLAQAEAREAGESGQGHMSHKWELKPLLLPYPVCRVCGVVERRDGQNSPCKGPTTISTRASAPDAAAVIAQAKAALEVNACNCADCKSSDCKAARAALAAIGAWEVGR